MSVNVAAIYEWAQFDGDPNSGEHALWLSSYGGFKI